LSRVREESEEAEGSEGSHGAGVVVSGQAGGGGVEEGGGVGMGAKGRESGTAGVVVEEDGEERGFVADVR
jgi:hypothetical protein